MQSRNVQLGAVVIGLAVLAAAIFFLRQGSQENAALNAPPPQMRSYSDKVTDVPKTNSVTTRGDQTTGYSGPVSTHDLFPDLDLSGEEKEEEWSEEDCKAFTATLRAGGVGGGDSKSVAEMNSWCGAKAVSPAFMKCASNKKGSEALLKCATDHIKLEGKDLEEVLDLAKAQEIADRDE